MNMPKLVVYKRDIKALEKAHAVCKVMAAHYPFVEEYSEALKWLSLVIDELGPRNEEVTSEDK